MRHKNRNVTDELNMALARIGPQFFPTEWEELPLHKLMEPNLARQTFTFPRPARALARAWQRRVPAGPIGAVP